MSGKLEVTQTMRLPAYFDQVAAVVDALHIEADKAGLGDKRVVLLHHGVDRSKPGMDPQLIVQVREL